MFSENGKILIELIGITSSYRNVPAGIPSIPPISVTWNSGFFPLIATQQ
jgi:hypothetical protein